MLLAGIVLALASAVFHASWNLLLKASADPLRLSARALPAATLLVTPAVGVLWLRTGRPGLPWQGWALAGLSGAVELAYFQLLSLAYRRGDISSVYPVARGSAPLLAVVAGLLLFGERLSAAQAAGTTCLLAGIWLARPPRHDRGVLWPALLTGVTITTYTAIDRAGVRLGPFWLYGWAVFVATSLLLLPWRGAGPAPHVRVVGFLTMGAYCLVLAALSLAPLALVSPLRESGVVLVALWAVFRLGERQRAGMKLAGAAAVLAGATVLAVTA